MKILQKFCALIEELEFIIMKRESNKIVEEPLHLELCEKRLCDSKRFLFGERRTKFPQKFVKHKNLCRSCAHKLMTTFVSVRKENEI